MPHQRSRLSLVIHYNNSGPCLSTAHSFSYAVVRIQGLCHGLYNILRPSGSELVFIHCCCDVVGGTFYFSVLLLRVQHQMWTCMFNIEFNMLLRVQHATQSSTCYLEFNIKCGRICSTQSSTCYLEFNMLLRVQHASQSSTSNMDIYVQHRVQHATYSST